MFAKLKKKLQDEGGSESEKSHMSPPSSGVAGPRRKQSAPPNLSPNKSDGDSEFTNRSTEDLSVVDSVVSPDEVVSMLMKRSEQCKRLEGKISEYAAIIKEKNRNIESLESSIERQRDDSAKTVQSLKEHFQNNRAKMTESLSLAMEKKEEDIQKKMDVVKQENSAMAARLKDAEDLHSQLYKREEENDEIHGLAAQESATIKHLLLNTQEDLSKSRQHVKEKSEKLDLSVKQVKELQIQVTALRDRLENIEKENTRLSEENRAQTDTVKSLTTERAKYESRVQELTRKLTEKSKQLTHQLHACSDFENEQQVLKRKLELISSQMSKLQLEKDENTDHFQEKVKTLEKRLLAQDLSGDERVEALQEERISLERKLEESWQHLSEVKSTWSDKISHLEEQISHLNSKIAEDGEDLAHSEQMAESMRDNFQKQIEDFHAKLEDAERRSLENWELANQKDIQYDKETQQLEEKTNVMKLEASRSETRLQADVSSLQSRLRSLETAKEVQKNTADQKIARLESQERESIEHEIQAERQISELAEEKRMLMDNVSIAQSQCSRITSELDLKKAEIASLSEKVFILENEVTVTQDNLVSYEKSATGKNAALEESKKETEELIVQNDELTNQLKSLQTEVQENNVQHEAEDTQKSDLISSLEASINQLKDQVVHYEKKVKRLETLQEQSTNSVESVKRLNNLVSELESQLSEKTKTVKVQQQRLSDLKKTLQRELKVQALPNDELNGSEYMSTLARPNKSMCFYQPHRDNHTKAIPPWRRQRNPSPVSDGDEQQSYGDSVRSSLEDDINFKYLKHVVLKFMLSRESEAIQLIRAVAVLLRFSLDEQRLIKDTLEYKMSWFGSKPTTSRVPYR